MVRYVGKKTSRFVYPNVFVLVKNKAGIPIIGTHVETENIDAKNIDESPEARLR